MPSRYVATTLALVLFILRPDVVDGISAQGFAPARNDSAFAGLGIYQTGAKHGANSASEAAATDARVPHFLESLAAAAEEVGGEPATATGAGDEVLLSAPGMHGRRLLATYAYSDSTISISTYFGCYRDCDAPGRVFASSFNNYNPLQCLQAVKNNGYSVFALEFPGDLLSERPRSISIWTCSLFVAHSHC